MDSKGGWRFNFCMRRVFILSWIVASIFSANAGEQLSPTKDGPKLADELSQKLYAQGSFQATYDIFVAGRDKPVGIMEFLFNNEQRYSLLKMSEPKSFFGLVHWTNSFYVVVDVSALNKESGNIKMLAITGTKGREGQFSFKQMLEHLDNPVSIFSFICKQLQPDSTNFVDPAALCIMHPTLSLGLGSTNIALGYLSGGTNLEVSWLDPNEITNALAIAENLDSVQFSYPHNRIVSVDRQTGLLLDDSMPKPVRHNPREIKLVKQSRLESPVPYSLLIPEFNRIKFKEFPSKLFYNRLATKYFADVGQQLKTNNDFEAMFLTNSAKLIAAAREAGHEMVRADAEARATPERIMHWRNKTLIPAYKDYLKNPPVDMKDLSFTNLLVWASSIAKTNVNLMMSPGASTLVDKAIEEIPDVISTLPRDLQKPYTKINAILLPALLEGGMSEYLTVALNRVRTLPPPDLNSEEANAYVKRGTLEQQRKDWADAIYDFQKAMELMPGDASMKKKLDEVKTQAKE